MRRRSRSPYRSDRPGGLGASGGGRCTPISNLFHGSLAWTDATGTAELIRKRQVSAREVVQAAIDRAEAVNPKLNFLVTADFERALKRAGQPLAGSLAGVPTLIKDLYELQGLPTKNGSRADAHAPPAKASRSPPSRRF